MSTSPNNASYDHFGYLSFLFSIATVISFFVYLIFIYPGIDLQEEIKEIESTTIESTSPVKIDISKIAEPWKPHADMVAHGKTLYATQCSMCHGAEGKGDGSAGGGLNPKPRNLVTGPWKLGGGYIGLYKAITQGIPGGSMSSYAHLSISDRWALVQFIDSITQAKIKETEAEIEAFARSAK